VAENKVILEFVGDVSGLKPAIDTLTQLGNLSEEQVNAFKKANEQFAKTSKEANNADKSVSKLATSFKQVSGAVAGKAIVEPLQQMAKAAETSTQKMFNLARQLAVLRREGKENTAEFKALQQEINKIDAANNISKVTAKTLTLKGELRALKAELAGLQEGTAEFERLAQRAGKLEDQISDVNQRVKVLASDTFKFDAAVDAVRGITAAFSVAQGAAALFGNESEDVQKALLKVQGATALLTGVQEIANQVTGQGAAKLAILSAAQRVQTFVTTGATAAVNGFRVALLSLGIGAVVAVLGALLVYWEDIAKFIGISAENTKKYEVAAVELKGTLEQQLEVLKAQGAAQNDIISKEKQINSERIKSLTGQIDALSRITNLGNAVVVINDKLYNQEQLNNYVQGLRQELEILQAKNVGIDKELKGKKEVLKVTKDIKKELEETISIPLITESDDINNYAKELAERIAKALEKTDLSKQLGELIGKIEVPPIKIDIELERAVERQKFIQEQLGAELVKNFQTVFDAAFQIQQQNSQLAFNNELRQSEELKNRELENEELSAAQRASIERRYQQQQAQIRRRQFESEKKAALAQAAINGALAITTLATRVPPVTIGGFPNPAFIAGLAATVISTAAQIAVISSQKAPQFGDGGWVGGKLHTQGGTMIEAERDEFVVNRRSARKYSPLLNALNDNKIPVAKALSLLDYKPSVADNDMIVLENKNAIDYSKLGRAVAREMSKLPQSELQVNYRGLLSSINSQESLIQWQNKRYN
jgi:hypothetical protein